MRVAMVCVFLFESPGTTWAIADCMPVLITELIVMVMVVRYDIGVAGYANPCHWARIAAGFRHDIRVIENTKGPEPCGTEPNSVV
jgi:hypothetical protein